MKSEAVVFTGPGQVEVREVDLPALGPADALVEVEYSGISVGTERWCLNGAIQVSPDHMIDFPCVPGYQAGGVVVEVGPDVQDIAPGDRVFSLGGRFVAPGIASYWGGHMHYHVNAARNLIRVPDSVSLQVASHLLLAQVGYNGARRPRVNPGDTAVVIGDGLVGQWAAQVLRHRGARVILAGHQPFRLQIAASHSADEVINTNEQDLAEYIRQNYPAGVQISAETVGRRSLIKYAIDLLQYEGQFLLLGYYPQGECSIDTHWVRNKELTVYCPNANTRQRNEQTLALIEQGAMKVAELITHEFPASQAADAYRLMQEKQTDFLGIVLRWKG